jgi:hypothetical protein
MIFLFTAKQQADIAYYAKQNGLRLFKKGKNFTFLLNQYSITALKSQPSLQFFQKRSGFAP